MKQPSNKEVLSKEVWSDLLSNYFGISDRILAEKLNSVTIFSGKEFKKRLLKMLSHF